MNIDNMTYGEMKQIAALFGNNTSTAKPPHPMIGKYVIARCYSAGVHAGTVKSADGENVILENSVRLWSWKAKDGVALSGVAQHGLTKDKSKLDSKTRSFI
jgi:ferredoxin-fold anticodon binding domain-containing protein